MTAREYRRVRGYVRANAAYVSAWQRWHGSTPGRRDAERAAVEAARDRELYAWSRLPERARAAILNPAPEVKP